MFKLQLEKITTRKKKGSVESSDWPFFPAGSNYNQKKITTGKIKSTVVWPMEAAQIWRERYNQKKMYSRLASYVFQRVQIITGKDYDRKKRYSRLAVSWKLEKFTSGKKGTVIWSSVGGQNTKNNTHHRHKNQQDVW